MIATLRPAGALFIASAVAACAAPSTADDPARVPPVLGQDAIEAWFAAGYYLRWTCEDPRATAAPSPHGAIRRCTNPIAAAAGVDAIDAALVVELQDGGGAITGRAAQRHTRPELSGEAWYWYLRDATGLVADGWGFEGPPQTDCAACHQRAGQDLPGQDYVFDDH